MVIDPTITYGAMIEIAVLGVGGLGFLYAMRTTIAVLAVRMGRVELEINKLSELVANTARIEERVVTLRTENVTMRAEVAAMAIRLVAVETKQNLGHMGLQPA